MTSWILILFAIIVGTMVPLQAGVNASLAKYLTHPFQAAFISFLGGLILMTIGCLAFGNALPAPSKVIQVPPILLIGGLLGGIMVMTSILLAPKLGAVVLISSYMVGQLLASILLDHFGLIGYSPHPINIWRILGVVFLLLGLYLVRKF